mmetsp:Transcript_111793/g.303484  ORF Transcript_111793/g.303484 Transcript_111793/m.303484 type:complete len:405 (+) Transcript_111793:298-1512(+)
MGRRGNRLGGCWAGLRSLSGRGAQQLGGEGHDGGQAGRAEALGPRGGSRRLTGGGAHVRVQHARGARGVLGRRAQLHAPLAGRPAAPGRHQVAPRLVEGLVEGGRVPREHLRPAPELRVGQQRHVGREAHAGVLRLVPQAPLVVPAGAGPQLPLPVDQVHEELVAPLRGRAGPGALEAAGPRGPPRARRPVAHGGARAHVRVHLRLAGLVRGQPRRVPVLPVRAGPVRLAEGVAAADQRHGGSGVGPHLLEDGPDVPGAPRRVGHPHRALRVHVDQAHLHRRQRRLVRPLLARALRGARARRHLLLQRARAQRQAPVAVGLVQASEAELRQRCALVPHGVGSRQRDQVAPAQPGPVLLLQRPQQRPRLVQVRVVLPARFWVEALAAAARPAPAVGAAEGAGGVP